MPIRFILLILLGFVANAFADKPHVVMLIAEKEYLTKDTLPKFAASHLANDHRVTILQPTADDRNSFPGLAEAMKDADLLVVSVRRRTPPEAELNLIRKFVTAGKPVIGIRTANHAFALRGDQKPPAGHAAWQTWDPDVFGGAYHGHHGKKLATTAQRVQDAGEHPILKGVSKDAFPTGGSLYEVRPLKKGTTVLLDGRAESIKQSEPVAWTFTRADGGRSFYTSLGHEQDFQNPNFIKLLTNAVHWCLQPQPASQP